MTQAEFLSQFGEHPTIIRDVLDNPNVLNPPNDPALVETYFDIASTLRGDRFLDLLRADWKPAVTDESQKIIKEPYWFYYVSPTGLDLLNRLREEHP